MRRNRFITATQVQFLEKKLSNCLYQVLLEICEKKTRALLGMRSFIKIVQKLEVGA